MSRGKRTTTPSLFFHLETRLGPMFLLLLPLGIQGYTLVYNPRETRKHTQVFMFLQERMDLHIGA